MSAVALQSFIYEAEAVRVVMVDDKPWWVAGDIAARLGYRHTPHMLRMLGEHQKGIHKVDTPGGKQELTIISEGGLFKCILRSKRPEAEKFGDWVTDELLPTLRLTGRYEVANDETMVEHPQMPDEVEALRVKLAIAREARVVFGLKQARRAWRLIGLLPELTDGMVEARPELFVPKAVGLLNQSVCDWAEARTEAAPGNRISSMVLYNDYLDWGKSEGLSGHSLATLSGFGRTLSNLGVESIKSTHVYRLGIKLVGD